MEFQPNLSYCSQEFHGDYNMYEECDIAVRGEEQCDTVQETMYLMTFVNIRAAYTGIINS